MKFYDFLRVTGFRLKKSRYFNIIFTPFAIVCYFINLFPFKRSVRVLVANMGGLGDILMMSSMAVELSRSYEIDLVVQSPFIKEIFKGQDYFSKIIVIQNYGIGRFRRPSKRLLSTMLLLLFYPLEYIRFTLRGYRIGLNCAHFPWNSNFTNVLLKALNIPERYGFSDDNGLYLHKCLKAGNLCGSDLYLSLLKLFHGKSSISNELYYYVSDEQTKRISTYVVSPHMTENIRKIAVLHPGGKIHVNSRRWPKEHFVELGKFLVVNKFAVFISGEGQGDEEVCHYVANGIGPNSINLCDKITFPDFAALLKLANLCITNDTSTVHLANAVKCKKIISIFGPTSSESFVKKNHRNIIIQSKIECSPCRKSVIHQEIIPCPRQIKIECLKSITPKEVIDQITKIL
jgi:ADP-heptose:LPS heptosyltransferase